MSGAGGSATLGPEAREAPEGQPATAIGILQSAAFAYRLLMSKGGRLVSLVWLPIVLAQVCLYIGGSGYLDELQQFLKAPNPKLASLAFAFLVGGILAAMFFWTMAISAVADVALERPMPGRSFYLRAKLQEWRLYAGYLRFLLLLCLLAGGIGFFLSSLGPLFPGSGFVPVWIYAVAIIGALFWFTARVCFLMPPIVAQTKGMIVREIGRAHV